MVIDFLIAFSLNAILVLAVFLILAAPISSCLLSVFQKEKNYKFKSHQNFLINTLIFTLIYYGSARLQMGLKYLYLPIISIVAISYLNGIVKGKSSPISRLVFISKSREMLPPSLSIATGLWAVTPAIFKISKNDMTLGLGSIGNNDVIHYALMAKDFIKFGFKNGGQLQNLDLGYNNHFYQYQSISALISLISTTFGLEPWQIMIAFSAILITFGTLTLSYFAQTFFGISKFASTIIASIVLLTPLMSYILGNSFLAQLCAVAISIETLRIFLIFASNAELNHEEWLMIPVLVALSIFVYPVFLIPWFAISFAAFLLLTFVLRRSIPIKKLFSFILFSLFGVVIAFDYLLVAFGIASIQSSATAGWPIPPLNPLSIFISSYFIGVPFDGSIFLISWLLMFVTYLLLHFRSDLQQTLKNFSLVGLLLSAVLVFSFAIFRTQSFSSYQIWKLETFFFPALCLMFLSVAFFAGGIGKLVILTLGICALISPINTWKSAINSEDLVVNSEMIEVSSNDNITQLDVLNIDVNPYFENMAMFALIDVNRIFIKGTQYFVPKSDDNACTLIRLDNRKYEKALKLTENYGLAPSNNNNCLPTSMISTVNELPMSSEVFFNDVGIGKNYLLSGWSGPENWGTWATAENSTLVFQIPETTNTSAIVTMKAQPYLPEKYPTPILKIFVNGKNVFERQTSPENFAEVIKFRADLFAKGTKNELTFEISPIYSPSDVSESKDPRKLGLGLISMKIEIEK
jgi:hypothetical protein